MRASYVSNVDFSDGGSSEWTEPLSDATDHGAKDPQQSRQLGQRDRRWGDVFLHPFIQRHMAQILNRAEWVRAGVAISASEHARASPLHMPPCPPGTAPTGWWRRSGQPPRTAQDSAASLKKKRSTRSVNTHDPSENIHYQKREECPKPDKRQKCLHLIRL